MGCVCDAAVTSELCGVSGSGVSAERWLRSRSAKGYVRWVFLRSCQLADHRVSATYDEMELVGCMGCR